MRRSRRNVAGTQASWRTPRVPLAATLAAAWLAIASLALATAYPVLDLDARLELAHDVFIGRVTSLDGERRGDDPWTLVTLSVDSWFVRNGALAETGPFDVTLAFLGGDATGTTPRQVAGLPSFAVGERILVMSYGDETGAASPLVGVTQGLWREADGSWLDAFGEALAIDATGRLTLARDGDPASIWEPALRDRLRDVRGAP